MTRAEQNEHILKRIVGQLEDKPGVQDVIEETFTGWFQSLAMEGLAMMAPQPEQAPMGEGEVM